MHPGLVNPSHIERCMQIAHNVKLNSGCLSRQVGAVVTDDNYSIKSVGWNHTPEGQIPCNLRNLESLLQNDDKEAFSDFELNNQRFRTFLKEKTNGKLGDRKMLRGRLFCQSLRILGGPLRINQLALDPDSLTFFLNIIL
jgi:hypothetical protein